MIASMTGFGRGSAQRGSITATVEMRSVNNRFIDIVARLPKDLADRETDLQNLVKQTFDRGRINVQVEIERDAEADLAMKVNEPAARAYGRLLDALRKAAGIDEPVRMEHLLRYTDVFTTAEADPETKVEMWDAVQAALVEAMVNMQAMRRQEGQALQADLEARIETIEQNLAQVEARAPVRVEETGARLKERLEALLVDDRIDPDRLLQEIAILADRLDVDEECVRLHSHLHLFREALADTEPVGRKLNFIVQEIHREVNTISSKANDADIARLSVDMKEAVEKIREQIQNVE